MATVPAIASRSPSWWSTEDTEAGSPRRSRARSWRRRGSWASYEGDMTFTEFLEKWGKTVFEGPLATSTQHTSPPEFAEIRLAALEEVRRKSYRAGTKKVFPFDRIHVSLRGVEES